MSRILDTMHLSPEVKIGVPDFDDRYRIMNAPAAKARETLREEVRTAIRALDPFVWLRLSQADYTMLKDVDLDRYGADDVVGDLEALARVVALIGA